MGGSRRLTKGEERGVFVLNIKRVRVREEGYIYTIFTL